MFTCLISGGFDRLVVGWFTIRLCETNRPPANPTDKPHTAIAEISHQFFLDCVRTSLRRRIWQLAQTIFSPHTMAVSSLPITWPQFSQTSVEGVVMISSLM
jgi:hypothetical protein